MLSSDHVRNLLVLHRAFDVGPILARTLLTYFSNNSADILCADAALLRKLGLSEKTIFNLKQPDWRAIDRNLEWASKKEQTILTFDEVNYPPLLKEIISAPLLIFVKGNSAILSDPQLAIVGSRNPTPTGTENAYAFAKNLAAVGMIITSGLALGIDAAGHLGVLEGKGFTIAVMGTGLDFIYPQRNIKLAEKIISCGGALISEFPLGVPPIPSNFPQRNRIISGLSLGVLVVEAALKSGSLITARLALEQGREVFAIPGSIHNPLAKGCHSLLQQGAKLVENISDILAEFSSLVSKLRNPHISLNNKPASNKLDSNLQKLLNCFGYETTCLEILLERSNLTISEITTMLVALEIEGCIKAVPGGYVRL